MTVYVDADACPVVDDVVELCAPEEVVLVHNRHHLHERPEPHVRTLETGDRRDAADHVIHRHVSAGDVVVTDDLGLAALVLPREAAVVRFRGDRVRSEDIEGRLAMRHQAGKQRRAGGRTRGPSSFDPPDRRRFRRTMRRLIDERDDPSGGEEPDPAGD